MDIAPSTNYTENEESSMAKPTSIRTQTRGSSKTGQHKGAHRTKTRSTAKNPQGETTPRHIPSEVNREPSSDSKYGARSAQRSRPDDSVDEETCAQSRRPGGSGDVSFGDADEGPEGPAR
jgi:hypothetical protein